MWTRYQRCEPLNPSAYLERAVSAFWQGAYERAIDILREGEIALGTNLFTAAYKQRSLLALGRTEEAMAMAPSFINDTAFFGMGAEAMPLAMSGDIEGARAAMEQWIAERGRNLRNELEINAAIGDRVRANELAAEIDARPGGSMVLLLANNICACGAVFDLDATPNFSARIREAGIDWPRPAHIHYPAKDW